MPPPISVEHWELRGRAGDRLDGVVQRIIGTGLGLSIVMGLVRQNHGNIRMHSPPGKGATFLIDFLAVKAPM